MKSALRKKTRNACIEINKYCNTFGEEIRRIIRIIKRIKSDLRKEKIVVSSKEILSCISELQAKNKVNKSPDRLSKESTQSLHKIELKKNNPVHQWVIESIMNKIKC